jgi:hypothetical protein
MKLFCLLPAFVFAGVDTRTDLSAVAKFGEAQATHNAYKPADAQNQNRGGLAHGAASNLVALVAAGARTCSSLTCVHETHHCNHATKLFATHAAWQARCNSAAFSSVRVTHSCKAADGSLGTAAKIMHKCEQAPEDRCLRGHFCAVDTDRTCKCVEQFPHARIIACANQDGPTCKSCAGAHTLQDNKCVLHGGWANFGSCSKACGGGVETRICDNPKPADGGDFCWGTATKACNTQACYDPSIVKFNYHHRHYCTSSGAAHCQCEWRASRRRLRLHHDGEATTDIDSTLLLPPPSSLSRTNRRLRATVWHLHHFRAG